MKGELELLQDQIKLPNANIQIDLGFLSFKKK